MLRGRHRQRVAVDALLDRARAGRGGVLVLRGGPGSGKSALLDAARRAAAERATGGREVLLCVDDAHLLDDTAWLDDLVADLADEPVALLIATEGDARGLPWVRLDPLDHADSLRVLRDLRPGLPPGLADEVADLARGNPLALVELTRALTSEQIGGTAPPPDGLPADSSLRARFTARFHALPAQARFAAALRVVDDEVDDDTLARMPDLDLDAVEDARALLDGGPLARAALRDALPLPLRFAAHAALAGALPPGPRRTWHEAARAPGNRDAFADRLADSAGRARRCGDYPAAARDHDRAATLASGPDARARHLIAAATDHWAHGAPRRARVALRTAARLTDSDELRARAELVKGGIDLGHGMPDVAVRRLLHAAGELVHTHRALAITALGFAGEAASIAGDHARYAETAAFAARLRRPDEPDRTRITLDHLAGMAATFAGRHTEALPALRSVVELAERVPHPQAKIWGGQAAYTLGDATRAHELATSAVTAAHEQGLTSLVPWALVYRALSALLLDQHSVALSAAFEGVHAATAISQHNAVVDHLTILALLAALRGDTDTAVHRVETAAEQIAQRGLGRSGTFGAWASACVDLALDRPADALDRLRLMTAGAGGVHAGIKVMAAPHVVEAAVGCGRRSTADRALGRYEKWVGATNSPARLALSHRCRAMLDDGAAGDEHFREAIRLHRASGTAMELAKTELFYGHRLRRGRKPRAARDVLRDAVKIFQRYEADRWVARARAELRAAGETVTGPADAPPTGDRVASLTPQQAQIARLVAEGATNREVAARLFLSHRTVEHHLRNIFARLEVRSRVELTRVLD
ncbi:LuxR C-terminal-related transcriptional regulator [Saccharothrix longispora]|uniref:LuxR C-terminal-related transcriptional regulator n=1 Tax=Saccharothrix longispora TaxID=33920 RepID=UPI0028FD41CE|nr:LuxR C-terminal-related transcriptional regulator [Saccharothrix longispora]MDU0294008.1 LuxR C-terminal-related transcriptional regulator [Saccharothrix longispora]